MKTSRISPRLVVALLALAAVLLPVLVGQARKSVIQKPDKSLEIERYPDEPLELVDLKIGENSIKKALKVKSRDNISKWGRDHVEFKEKDGWFKHVKIKLRNVSGRPIYGIKAGLHFEYPGLKVLFGLPLTCTRDLKREPLQPGHEMGLEVTEELLERAIGRMISYGADPNNSSVSFSLDDAYFSEDLKWSRGHLLKRDSNNRLKWDVVAEPDPSGASRLEKPAGFALIGFKNNHAAFQSTQTCQAVRGGELGYQCNGDYDYCLRIVENGNGSAGSLSSFPEPGGVSTRRGRDILPEPDDALQAQL